MTDLAMARVDRAISVAQKRAERIRTGMRTFVETRREIAAAYGERDWVTLGYASFEEYVDSEFSESRLRLSPDERREAVTELRRAGMSQRAIGTTLGVDAATVNRDLRTVADATVPDRITGTDGRKQPATRPALNPQTPAPAVTPSAAAGSTFPEPASRHLSVAPEPAPSTTAARELADEIARDSERRAVVAGLRSVLTYLTSRVLAPGDLAQQYLMGLDDFTAEDLRYAAETMAAIAALKEQ